MIECHIYFAIIDYSNNIVTKFLYLIEQVSLNDVRTPVEKL